jgi:hypothetical protein
MGVWNKVSESFELDEENWMRHANSLSVYTRIPGLTLFVIAFYSRLWIGWYCLIPVILLGIWTKINPKFFPKPKHTNTWASKGVFGERVWLNDKKIKIPKHHKLAAKILTFSMIVSSIILVYAIYSFNLMLTIGFTIISNLLKLWFVDRMVWLYEDMKHEPRYKKWLY